MATETIIVAPCDIWIAPVDTAEVGIDVVVPNAWDKFGKSYWDDGGITVEVSREILKETVDSSLYVQKAFNGKVEIMASGVVKDMSLETLSVLFNGNAVTATAKTATKPGFKNMDLEMDIAVEEYAMLFRFYTPYDTGGLTNAKSGAQLWLPRAFESGGLNVPLAQTESAKTPFEFQAMESDTLGVGKFKFKTANAT